MKKGISLVALVITIIVLIILTATVILTAFNNGILDRSEEAVFKNNIRTFQEDFANKKLKVQNKNYTDKNGQKIDVDEIDASNTEGNIIEWIPSITNDFIDKIYIENGVFKADEPKFTDQQLVWLEELGIVTGIAPVIGTTDIWQLDDTKTKIVACLSERIDSDSFTIPNKIKDSATNEVYNITKVEGNVFENTVITANIIVSSGLTFDYDFTKLGGYAGSINPDKIYVQDNVTFEDGFRCPGAYGFYEIIIGDNVTVQGDFEEDEFLTGDEIKKVSIGNNFYCADFTDVLYGNEFEEVIIGNNATLPNNIFERATNLKTLTIGKSLSISASHTTVAHFLEGVPSTANISIESFGNLGTQALQNCTILEKIVIEDGATLSGTNIFDGCTGVKELVLGNATITTANTFAGCTNLEKVTIRSNAGQNISSSFSGMTSIKEVIIEDNATVNSTFSQCTGITTISIGNNVTFGNKGGIFNKAGITEIYIPKNTQFSQNTSAVFVNCTNLTKVTLEKGLTAIPKQMFQGCSKLTDVKIPSSVESIGANAFVYCTNLGTIYVGSQNVADLVVGSGFTGTVTIDSSIG